MSEAAVIGQCREMFDMVLEAHCMNMSNGAGFTCQEAEAMYACMIGVGALESAETFMAYHAETDDDDGDLHVPVYEHPTYPDSVTGWRYKTEEETNASATDN